MSGKTSLVCVLAATVAVIGSGCWYLAAGAAAAGGTYAYVQGELKETLPASLSRVAAATDSTVDQLDLEEVKRRVDGVVGHYELKTADDQTVTIELESTRTDTTRVRIRVGIVGDRRLSERILETIRSNL